MNNVWRVSDPALWSRKTSQLINVLESEGCEIEKLERSNTAQSFTVFLPGLDTFVLSAVKALPLPMTDQWMRSIRLCLWDRTELRFDQITRSIESRWIYWSPIQSFIHATICGVFLLKVFFMPDATISDLALLLLSCGILNTFAVLLSWKEQTRLNSFFLSLNFTQDLTR